MEVRSLKIHKKVKYYSKILKDLEKMIILRSKNSLKKKIRIKLIMEKGNR